MAGHRCCTNSRLRHRVTGWGARSFAVAMWESDAVESSDAALVSLIAFASAGSDFDDWGCVECFLV